MISSKENHALRMTSIKKKIKKIIVFQVTGNVHSAEKSSIPFMTPKDMPKKSFSPQTQTIQSSLHLTCGTTLDEFLPFLGNCRTNFHNISCAIGTDEIITLPNFNENASDEHTLDRGTLRTKKWLKKFFFDICIVEMCAKLLK